MRTKTILRGRTLAPVLAAALALGMTATLAGPTLAQTVAKAPTTTLTLALGRGRLVTLNAPMSDLFVADDKIADVQVRSPTQLYVFGKAAGETTIYATAKSGAVVYSSNVRVGTNIDSIGQMLALAMPEVQVTATPMNGLVLLTGTVASPDDAAEAERLVQAFVGETTKIVTRLRTATPLQVNLQVRIAEVSRTFAKNVGNNLVARDTTGGFSFGVGSGRSPGIPGNVSQGEQRTSLGYAGKLLGLDVLGALDLGESLGQVTTLSNPNLTALSGETASFLAGGEIPIPISQGLGQVSIEYKQFGVSLAYTPTVLSDGRISLRVRPEVSQLGTPVSFSGGVAYGLSTRRVETTVELGSGQSFVIAGLLSNTHDNNFDKTPGIGDLPVLGALFRSNAFRRNETELMVVVTPYLVKPVSANQIVLPTDGYKAPTDLERLLLGRTTGGTNGAQRPIPTNGPPSVVAPVIGSRDLPAGPSFPAPAPRAASERAPSKRTAVAAAPGFSLK